MTARVLDGKALAAAIRADAARRSAALAAERGRPPCLAAVLVGDDPASVSYAAMKARWAERCGITYQLIRMPAAAGQPALVGHVESLNADENVDGILLEMPLPDGYDARTAQAAIDPEQDVEGVTPTNLGRLVAGARGVRPATAVAIMALLDDADVSIAGRRAVVVGRSVVVGKPVALLLLAAHATVCVAHTQTQDLGSLTRAADIVVAAAGSPGLISAAGIRPGAVVIDAGTTLVGDGDDARLVGDADYAALLPVAAAITPVPGGVGPVTTAVLLRTLVELAERRWG
jgi:methylenetetrahydrofolate dehydrogenase (NADP+)/methenyltetrahydrofolate cyclohydrolase